MAAFAHTQSDHDETLIARLAAGDVDGRERTTATAQLADCPACAQLHADLRSIMAATAGLPAPHRTRDFQLTEADAARLRRTGLRAVLARFGDPRLAFTRPLATGLVALGIAGLVLAAGPSLVPSLGSAGAAPALSPVGAPVGGIEASAGPAGNLFGSDSDASAPGAGGLSASANPVRSAAPPVAVTGSTSPAASEPPPVAAASSAIASVAPADLGVGGGAAIGSPGAPVLDQNQGIGKSVADGSGSAGSPSPLLLVSLALLAIGIVLFLLRWVARRTG